MENSETAHQERSTRRLRHRKEVDAVRRRDIGDEGFEIAGGRIDETEIVGASARGEDVVRPDPRYGDLDDAIVLGVGKEEVALAGAGKYGVVETRDGGASR